MMYNNIKYYWNSEAVLDFKPIETSGNNKIIICSFIKKGINIYIFINTVIN